MGLHSPYLSENLIQVWKFVWKFILVNVPTFDGKFFLLTPLWLLQDPWIIYRCFQAVVIFHLLKVAKLNIYTYKDPSDKSVSVQEVLYKIHTMYFIKKMLLKNISSLITAVVFAYVFVIHCSSLV